MGEGKQQIVAVQFPTQNPIEQFQAKFKEIQDICKCWLAKQSLPVEAAVVTATSAVQGAFLGSLLGTFSADLSSPMPTPPPGLSMDPKATNALKQAQALSGGPLIQARNFAVMTGVNAGISCVMKRLRGKEDIESSMVAAFGSGVMFSLVSGVSGGQNPLVGALQNGFFFAVVQGALFKVGQNFSKPPVEDIYYTKTRSLLSSIGLEKYEKNFKKGLLTDVTLPLLNESALRDVNIPPGPRLLILDQIQRDQNLKEKKRFS
ncbi:unnamed protein product [Cuscuta epithymum]|uniref:SAM domain-containing protein n=1 Tax=Cuscuta epithymum TaxID=186058 RepID=A0AAV0C2W8_9ASTE|nr:unnamed protein product [Cuscuta epithymum]